jgi:EF hand
MPASVSTTSSGSSRPRGADVLLKYGKSKGPGKGFTAVVVPKEAPVNNVKPLHAADDASEQTNNDSIGSVDVSSSGIDSFQVKALKESLGKLTPEAVFALFDTDGDRVISFDEFKAILPQLGIKVSMPKALRYFRNCDKNNNGVIDLEEFKVQQLYLLLLGIAYTQFEY